MPEEESGALTRKELLERAQAARGVVNKTTLNERLGEMVEGGHLKRKGKGKKGSPYRYWQA